MTDIQESLCRQRAWVKAWPFVCPPGLPEPSKPRLFTKQRFSSVLGTACVPSRCPRAVVVPCQGDGPPCGRQQGGVPPSPSPCFLKTGSPHPWFLCPPRCLTPTTSFPFYAFFTQFRFSGALIVSHTFCCCSVSQSCKTLCNPMSCSMPGFSVPHHLPKFAQVDVHCIYPW